MSLELDDLINAIASGIDRAYENINYSIYKNIKNTFMTAKDGTLIPKTYKFRLQDGRRLDVPEIALFGLEQSMQLSSAEIEFKIRAKEFSTKEEIDGDLHQWSNDTVEIEFTTSNCDHQDPSILKVKLQFTQVQRSESLSRLIEKYRDF